MSSFYDERIIELTKWSIYAPPHHRPKEPDKAADVGILEGISNTYTKRSRSRCANAKILVALGDCAVFGGVPAMRNCWCRCCPLRLHETESTDDSGMIPNDPELSPDPRSPASDVVKVDVFLPGCLSADALFMYYLTSPGQNAQGRGRIQ